MNVVVDFPVGVSQLLALGAACFFLIVIPGPSVLFVIGRALSYGRRTALLSALGNNLGAALLACLVAAGIGPLVQSSVLAFTAIKLAGAAYLIWLGVVALHKRKEPTLAAEPSTRAPTSARRAIRDGFVVGSLNPKSFIILAATLPQFVDRSSGEIPLQILALALVPIGIGLICDAGWGLVSSAARSWFETSPGRLTVLGRAGGVSMIGLGLFMALSGQHD